MVGDETMDLREQKFGVEVEMTGITRQRAAEVIGEYLNGRVEYDGGGYGIYSVRDNKNRKWQLVRDSSINCQKKVSGRKQAASREYSVELVSPICFYDDIEDIQEMIRELRKAGAFCNKSCGIRGH